MLLKKILPRELVPEPGSSECASLMTSLIMGVHLERTIARELGWRGVRAAASDHPAWTVRLASSDAIFGIRFAGENLEQDAKTLRGYFELFVFPPAESPLLELYPLNALAFAISAGYAEALRNFCGTEAEFAPFRLGWLRLDVPMDGSALGLVFEAPARHRIIALAGLRASHFQNASVSGDEWLVSPLKPFCNLPAFRLLLPLASLLVASAERLLESNARLALGHEFIPGRGIDAAGNEVELAEPQERIGIMRLKATFGENAADIALDGENFRPLKKLPARYKPIATDTGNKPLLHLLCGFLGAGKTTFLRRWLNFLHGRERYTGVIQNEFGAVDLDSGLLADDTLVEALDDGCVCCSLADSLRPGLARILSELSAQQFILETSGLANPVNVLEAVNSLADLVKPGLLISVADALGLHLDPSWENPDKGGIRRIQLAKADAIILNKCDLVGEQEKMDVIKGLRILNPQALLLCASNGNIPFAELDALIDRIGKRPAHKGTLVSLAEQLTHGQEGYASASAMPAGAILRASLEKELLGAGPDLVRAKGILELSGEGSVIVQYAQGILETVPACTKPTGLALIGRKLNLSALAARIEALSSPELKK